MSDRARVRWMLGLRSGGLVLAGIFALRSLLTMSRDTALAPLDPLPAILSVGVFLSAVACALSAWSRTAKAPAGVARLRTSFAIAQTLLGSLVAAWLVFALPGRLASDQAYARDPLCSVAVTARDKTSPLCRTLTASVVQAWSIRSRSDPTFFLAFAAADGPRVAQLDCLNAWLVYQAAGGLRLARVQLYGARITGVGAGGLSCDTTYTPSPAATRALAVDALFGLGVAIAGIALLRWDGRRSRARTLAVAATPSSS